ncbi:MAG TPA: hypothetical protein PK951_13885 [Chitinophagaceae bacterium]|nr:hypothetical protein [Chitinophagaceae bacterium]
MRKICLVLSVLFFISTVIAPAYAATTTMPGVPPKTPGELMQMLASLKIKDIQKYTGKKLTLKQKISFILVKHKLKRKISNEKDPGQLPLIFGITGAALFIAGLFLPYVIVGALAAAIVAVVTGSSVKRKDPNNRKAHAGKLLGWITLALIALTAILVAIVLSISFA